MGAGVGDLRTLAGKIILGVVTKGEASKCNFNANQIQHLSSKQGYYFQLNIFLWHSLKIHILHYKCFAANASFQ
jgi:hypothetical protein